MNLKNVLVGVAYLVVAFAIMGGVIWCTSFMKGEKEEETQINDSIDVQNSIIEEDLSEVEVKEEVEILKMVNAEKKYQEDYDVYCYEVVLKNTSGKTLEKVELTFGDGIYELYYIMPDDEYKLIVYDTENPKLEIISVDFEIPYYFEGEISLELNIENSLVKGIVTNNGQRELYPSEVIYFLKDENGYTHQMLISYAGCFDEGRVISPQATHEFEFEIQDGYSLDSNKPIVVRYSDIEFRSVETVFFDQV